MGRARIEAPALPLLYVSLCMLHQDENGPAVWRHVRRDLLFSVDHAHLKSILWHHSRPDESGGLCSAARARRDGTPPC